MAKLSIHYDEDNFTRTLTVVHDNHEKVQHLVDWILAYRNGVITEKDVCQCPSESAFRACYRKACYLGLLPNGIKFPYVSS